MQLTQLQLARLLDVWPVARLATVGGDGLPRIVPIVFVAMDGVLYSPVDGKPKRSTQLQRLRDIEGNRNAALLLDHYDADWNALWWLRLDVECEVLTADSLPMSDRDRIALGLRGKYPQYELVPPFAGEPTVVRLHVLAHRAWSAHPLEWDRIAARCSDPTGRA